MKILFKKLDNKAVCPKKAYKADAGFDLTAINKYIDSNGNTVYDTGLAISLPENHVGLLFPRSSNAKKDLILSNSVGVLDSGYIGSILFKYKNLGNETYNIGDRIGQIIILPYPQIEFEEVEELSETDRGAGGYGSTGK